MSSALATGIQSKGGGRVLQGETSAMGASSHKEPLFCPTLPCARITPIVIPGARRRSWAMHGGRAAALGACSDSALIPRPPAAVPSGNA